MIMRSGSNRAVVLLGIVSAQDRQAITRRLSEAGHRCLALSSARELSETLQPTSLGAEANGPTDPLPPPAMLVLDFEFGDAEAKSTSAHSGSTCDSVGGLHRECVALELVRSHRRELAGAAVVFRTSDRQGAFDHAIEAMKLGAADVLAGPYGEPHGRRLAELAAALTSRDRLPLSPVQRQQRALIVEALDRADGHVVAAAEMLGMGQATVYRKIRLYGIARPRRGKRLANPPTSLPVTAPCG
jgi:ActR/RegA family two-component response regulator